MYYLGIGGTNKKKNKKYICTDDGCNGHLSILGIVQVSRQCHFFIAKPTPALRFSFSFLPEESVTFVYEATVITKSCFA